MKRLRIWIAVFAITLASLPVLAQERAYKDGPVVVVTAVKIVDGQFENYMDYLQGNWKRVMEASKTAGIVTEYHVYGAQAHNPNEADLYLVVSYPNMAALDNMDEKMEPIMSRVMKMNVKQRDEASGKRMVMRNILGEQLLRELVLK